jgi:hypothetical protein
MAKPEKHKPQDDGNSEKELIDLLKTVLSDMFQEVHTALHSFKDALALKETKDQERHNKLMTAFETITASVDANVAGQADLTTAVNALIVRVGTPGPSDAQLLSLAGQIDSSTASDKALTDAANAALNPPPPVP